MQVVEKFEDLKGMVCTGVCKSTNADALFFDLEDGRVFILYHSQDCCESVYIEDIVGDLSDLVNSEVLLAEEAHGEEHREVFDETFDEEVGMGLESWAFYKLSTIKGNVTIRWSGSSNGYYNIGVSFEEKRVLN